MAHYASSKKPGSILSAFKSDKDEELPEKYLSLKQELLNTNNLKDKLANSWTRLVKEIENETKEIKRLGPNVIPQVEFSDISKNGGTFPQNIAEEVRKRGMVVIRNVVPQDEALEYKEKVKEYIQNHKGEIAGFPDDDPQVWELYWSKSQVAARSHPNFVAAQTAMNSLWHAAPETLIDFSINTTYCDRLRIRKPGDTSFALAEHIDGGSVERWEDPEYRNCFKSILSGEWEKYDPYDATHRVNAIMDLYNCSGGCSMFRSFQGWLSLSTVFPGGGTLRVCPIIKLSTAYLILRPLLEDLVETTNMAGAKQGVQQHILPEFHQPLIDAVVSIPQVNPGDCVFWHCDGIHAVEECCNSVTDSSVFYIPSTPLCNNNIKYLARQRYALENGVTPQDFPLNNCEVDFSDRAKPSDLTELGKLGMGFTPLSLDAASTEKLSEGAINARKEFNKVLFEK
ncbi:hypothetical protein Ocin01_11564 [Orchesella cincta]|uniref:DUF1479-domain-containing protein n=1 Tax=Orchesella cincta TaxID=48709 RepID=A0A1D2MPX7_ORCCI|nr:hypothetical protein Ocin01_11564 [Orchesella cincta]